jgi:DNA-binding CsgD family transcriptional regulator
MTNALVDNILIGTNHADPLSSARSRAASEVGAAIAHQLNGPLTALLLYVGDLYMNRDRFPAESIDGQSLQQVAENAMQEAERACTLLAEISDAFSVALPQQSALAHGREVIGWWARANTKDTAGTSEQSEPFPSAHAAYQLLTRRERDVLQLISQGLTNKEGAFRLNIGPRTFESHRARIMRKFKARNTAHLVSMALQAPAPAEHGSTAAAGTRSRPEPDDCAPVDR